MTFSVFILLITSCGLWTVSLGIKFSAVADVFGLVTDIIGLGMAIHEKVSSEQLEKQIENLRTELLAEFDEIKLTIENLRVSVMRRIEQLQLTIKMQKIENFELSTAVRIQDLENMVASIPSEQTFYWDIFLHDIEEYVREARTVISYVISRSITSESLLYMVQTQSNCDMTDMRNFSDYVRDLVMTAISIEGTYKRHAHNLTLDIERAYWEEEVASFDSEVEHIFDECSKKFPDLFLKDISSNYSSLESLHDTLAKRYTDKTFFVLQLESQSIDMSNDTTFRCAYQDQKCGTKRCALYQLKEASCGEMVSVRINREGHGFYLQKISEDFPAVYATDLIPQVDYLIPKICPKWEQQSKTFITPSDTRYVWRDGLSKTCGDSNRSIRFGSETLTIVMMLLVSVLIT